MGHHPPPAGADADREVDPRGRQASRVASSTLTPSRSSSSARRSDGVASSGCSCRSDCIRLGAEHEPAGLDRQPSPKPSRGRHASGTSGSRPGAGRTPASPARTPCRMPAPPRAPAPRIGAPRAIDSLANRPPSPIPIAATAGVPVDLAEPLGARGRVRARSPNEPASPGRPALFPVEGRSKRSVGCPAAASLFRPASAAAVGGDLVPAPWSAEQDRAPAGRPSLAGLEEGERPCPGPCPGRWGSRKSKGGDQLAAARRRCPAC